MTIKEQALLQYLEFNLIGMVNTLRPHLKDGVNEEEIYGLAYDVLEEMNEVLTQPHGCTAETPD